MTTPLPRPFARRAIAAMASFALIAAACGSDTADDAAPADTTASASATEPARDDTGTDTTADPGAGAATDATADDHTEDTGDGATAADAAFPVTIDHKFGSTTIDAEPNRVVSIGFNEHDFLLALGVVPVGLRDWYGEQPNGVWPWAQDELGDATPAVLSAGDLNFEQIAALEPDVIVGVWSGITEQDYELLSAIAPVVAQPGEYEDYGTPWQEQTIILGRALGRATQAEAVVAEVEADIVAAREAHPEWEGLTASVAFVIDDGPGAYTSQDTRSRFMQDLGFTIPEINDSLGDGSFYLDLSPEDLSPLDVDALVWVVGSDEALDVIVNDLPTRRTLDVVQEGREIFADFELTGAFSHSSPLSLEFVVDTMVEELTAALDGDPSTPTPSSVKVGAVQAPASGDDDAPATEQDATQFTGEEAAAAAAWSLVFDSSVDFDDKAPHLEDAAALASTIAAYTAAGDGFGGISLVPTAISVDGDAATVTYDVNFGDSPAYSDVTGAMALVDGVWVVPRDEFCSFMASARVGCDA